MKKILAIIMLVAFVFTLGSCGNVTVENATEAAKLLLANERLNGEDLKKDGNIFTKGQMAFDRVKEETNKYRVKLGSKDSKLKFTKNGTRYSWSDAPDYSNFLSFFDSYATNIEFNAERGSELIDSTKKNIRVVNKWVDIGNDEVLLIVEENSETIFSRSDAQYEICRRYQNEEGLNVFEMSITNSDTNHSSRMTYIPGMRYEYASMQNEHLLVIIADNDKGYWDIMTTSFHQNDSNYASYTNLVMKDEAIYETSYSIDEVGEYFGNVELVSEDGKSDLLSYDNDTTISIFTTGINGLDSFYIDANEDEVYDLTKNNHQYPSRMEDYKVYSVGEGRDIQYFTQPVHHPTIKFDNGKEMKVGDVLYDGAITVRSSMVHPIGALDFYGDFVLNFSDNDIDFIFENLEKLSQDFGFTFKGDFDEIKESVKYASNDAINFSRYYKWNGYNINDLNNYKESCQVEMDLIQEFTDLYDEIKDFEVISRFDQAKLEESYYFADLMLSSKGSLSNDGFKVSINDLKVKVEDTILFVNGESYKVEIAVANYENGKYKNILPLQLSSTLSSAYNGEKSFELVQSTTVEIPLLEEGSYTLVAYIATLEEGIRVTKPIEVEGIITENSISYEGIINRIYNDGNKIVIDSNKDSTINVIFNGNYTYESLYNELESYAYNLGMTTNDEIYKQDGTNWIKVESNEEISSGVYRLRYVNSGNDAYIVATIS